MSTPTGTYSQNMHLSEPPEGSAYYPDAIQNQRGVDFALNGRNNYAYNGLVVTAGSGLTVNWSAGAAKVAGTDYPTINAGSGAATNNTANPNLHLANYVYINNAGAVVISAALPITAYAALAVVFTNAGAILSIVDCRDKGAVQNATNADTVDGFHASQLATLGGMNVFGAIQKFNPSAIGEKITLYDIGNPNLLTGIGIDLGGGPYECDFFGCTQGGSAQKFVFGTWDRTTFTKQFQIIGGKVDIGIVPLARMMRAEVTSIASTLNLGTVYAGDRILINWEGTCFPVSGIINYSITSLIGTTATWVSGASNTRLGGVSASTTSSIPFHLGISGVLQVTATGTLILGIFIETVEGLIGEQWHAMVLNNN